MLFASSNIVYLVTYWYIFVLVPGPYSDKMARHHPVLFSYLICKGIFYVNLSSFFLSELIVCTLSFHRVLAVFFPLKLIFFSSKFPKLFGILFGCFISLAFLIPIVNLIFNTSIDATAVQNIAEKSNLASYCYNSNNLAGK